MNDPYLRLARALAAHGIASIVANTRGHDLGALAQPKQGPPYWAGGLWERMEDSPRDLAAWVTRGAESGFPAAALLGHSLGAVKATHYLAERPDPRVPGLALASPPLRPSWDTRAHPRALAEARRLMAEGRPEALFAGPWGMVSAQTYVSFDRVGFDQFGRTTETPSLARVRCPIFVAIGEHDEQVCTPADLGVIRRSATGAPRVESHVIEGAVHFFTGHEAQVAALLARWVGAWLEAAIASNASPSLTGAPGEFTAPHLDEDVSCWAAAKHLPRTLLGHTHGRCFAPAQQDKYARGRRMEPEHVAKPKADDRWGADKE